MSKQNKTIDFSANTDLVESIKKDAEKCIDCKLCMRGCAMLDEFTDSPKELLLQLSTQKKFKTSLAYSCLICGYCAKVCPKDISFNDIFFKFREEVVKQNNGAVPISLNTSGISLHQKLSFSPLFSDPISNLKSEYVFFPGCALLSSSPKLVKKIYAYLQEKIPGVGYWNSCCGKPTNYLGKRLEFYQKLKKLKNEYRKKGVTKIIFACENCFMSFKKYCDDLEVISLYVLISELGLPKEAKNKFNDYPDKINIHDPCPTRNEDKLHDSVRTLLLKMGFEIEELKFTKRKTICCGAGGMVPFTAAYIANKHTTRRANEGDKMMVTYCKECVSRIGTYNRNIVHILDLIFDQKKFEYSLKKPSLIWSWKNRYVARQIAKENKNE